MMSFNTAYKFKKENVVIIKHSGNKNLRCKPGNLQAVDSNGRFGGFAQWLIKPQDIKGNTIKLQNKKTNKYLRIIEN